jgi:phosphoglycolate phosphatase
MEKSIDLFPSIDAADFLACEKRGHGWRPGIRAILFDIDGTLLKCHGAGKKALVQACTEVFGTIGAMDTVDFQGKTDPLILRESLGITGLSEADINRDIEALKRRYFRYLERNMRESGSVLLPGVEELLERLAGMDSVIQGLLTGNFREGARIKLGHFNLDRYFGFGVFGDDAARRNDMPPIARRIMREQFGLDVPYEDIVIIGDTVHDIECARASGAVSVAVGTGWIDREVLLSRGPDFYFEDMSDTEGVLAAIAAYA